MLIDNPDALKEWLTSILEPMCDADPNALAKYVIALVKKDKPMSELRDTCLDQLDVFLQHETKPFVELLFKALDDKSYLAKSGLVAQALLSQPVPPGVDVSTSFVNNAVVINSSNSAANSNNSINNVSDINRSASPTSTTVLPSIVSPTGLGGASKPVIGLSSTGSKVSERRLSRPELNVADNDERDVKRPIRKPVGNRSRSRSRSPSWSRNRSRSRSRERDDRRLRRGGHQDDDRRPSDRRRVIIGRRYDRYNDYRIPDRNRDRVERKRSRTRSRSPKSPRSRSRTASPGRNKERERPRVDGTSRAHSPHSQDHGDKDYRCISVPAVSGNAQLSTSQGTPPSNSSRGPTPNETQPAGRNARRCRDYDEKGYCMRGDLCPFDHGADPVVVEEVHLPNVLAYGPGGGAGGPPPGPGPGPGPGSMPRPPVPLPGAIPPLLGHPMGHPRPIPPPPLHQVPGPRHFPHMPDPYIPEPYNPEAPGLDRMPPRLRPPFWGPRMGPGHRGPRPPMPFMHAARELISVPTVDDSNIPDNMSTNNRRVMPPQLKPPNNSVAGAELPHQQRIFRNMGGNNVDPMGKRRPFDFNRLGARNKFKLDNAVLELRKIPHGLNSIAQLNNHFSRFGRIVNLQVCFEGDPEAALVQFSSHAEAHAAYRSTEAVLNNRFIKVFWHNKDDPSSATAAVTAPAEEVGVVQPVKKLSAKERLGLPVVPQNLDGDTDASHVGEEAEKSSVILATSGVLSKTVFNPAALRKSNFVTNSSQQSNSAKVKEECFTAHETIKKKQEEQRKEAFKIKADLMKREQELYIKQLQQQKLLIEKVERNKNMTATERGSIMTTVKLLQESIEKLKVGLESASVPSHPKTKQEAQKEILDIEMELYNRQHSGADTSDLRRKVAELKQEAVSMGLIDRVALRGGRGVLRKVIKGVRGGFRGRGGGGGRRGGGIMRSVDHRPRKLKIIGFAEEERDDVITHLAQYGEIENVGPEDDHLKLLVTFKTRREAELAAVQGAKYKDRKLSMEWQPNVSRRSSLAGDASADGLQDGLLGTEDELLDPDEDLLLGDDDDEEDSEARSWRR